MSRPETFGMTLVINIIYSNAQNYNTSQDVLVASMLLVTIVIFGIYYHAP